MDKKIVVTGGSGFIGGHLIEALYEQGETNILNLDIENGYDLTNYDQIADLFKKEKPDIVYNFAVLPLPASLTDPYSTVVKIIYMVVNLCEMARQGLFKRLVQISSSEAYGNALYKPQDEVHPLNPRTPYASAKASCDLVALSYHKTFGIDVVIPRCFNTYGERQPLKWGALIPKTISRIIYGMKPIIYQEAQRTRDFIYVKDLVQGILGVANNAPAGELVNIGTGKETSVMNMLEMICKLMNYKGEMEYQEQRPADVSQLCCDNSKAKKMFGFNPTTKLEEGLQRTIDYYVSTLSVDKNLH